VAKHVRVDALEASTPRGLLHDARKSPSGKWLVMRGVAFWQEQISFLTVSQVFSESSGGGPPEEHESLSVAFTQNADRAAAEIHVLKLDSDDLRKSAASRVEDLQHSAVAGSACGGYETVHLLNGQNTREPRGKLPGLQKSRRTGVDQAAERKEVIEAAKCVEFSGKGLR